MLRILWHHYKGIITRLSKHSTDCRWIIYQILFRPNGSWTLCSLHYALQESCILMVQHKTIEREEDCIACDSGFPCWLMFIFDVSMQRLTTGSLFFHFNVQVYRSSHFSNITACSSCTIWYINNDSMCYILLY